MSNEFKLDINISQKKIEEMAKQVIREIVESKIQIVLENMNINKIINDKINSLDIKLSKIVEKNTEKIIKNMSYGIEHKVKTNIHEIILEEIQKKPISGNVYLKINSENVETDYY